MLLPKQLEHGRSHGWPFVLELELTLVLQHGESVFFNLTLGNVNGREADLLDKIGSVLLSEIHIKPGNQKQNW